MKRAIEYNGELYDSYYSLFYDLSKEGKTPCPCWEGDEEYPLEKYILTEIMKLEVTERKIR